MSLINKMLKDLESRQNMPLGQPSRRPIFQDLHAVSDRGLTGRLSPLVLITVLIAAIAGAGYVWTQRAGTPMAAAPTPAKPTMLAAEPIDAQPEAAVAPTEVFSSLPPAATVPPITAPVAAVPTPPEPVVQKPAPPKPAAAPALRVPPPVVRTAPAPRRPTVVAAASAAPKRAAAARPEAGEDAADTDSAGGSMEKKVIPLTPKQSAENAYRTAAQQLQQRQLEEAEKGLTAALALNPRHIGARELLVGLLIDRGRMDEAQKLLEQGLASVPGQPAFAALLARLYVEQNAEPRAITLLEQQRRAGKPSPDTLALLATLYQRAARHGDAITAFKEALTLRPMEGKWWLGLGISQEAEQNWNEAGFAYQRVRDTNIEPRLARYAEQRLAIVRGK